MWATPAQRGNQQQGHRPDIFCSMYFSLADDASAALTTLYKLHRHGLRDLLMPVFRVG